MSLLHSFTKYFRLNTRRNNDEKKHKIEYCAKKLTKNINNKKEHIGKFVNIQQMLYI